MFLECTIYEYIKLSYVVSDAGHDTLYIFVLDITMCISKSNSSGAPKQAPIPILGAWAKKTTPMELLFGLPF